MKRSNEPKRGENWRRGYMLGYEAGQADALKSIRETIEVQVATKVAEIPSAGHNNRGEMLIRYIDAQNAVGAGVWSVPNKNV